MRKWTTQRENADSGSVLSIPMIVRNPDPVQPELVYGNHFHCPACGTAYMLTEAVDPSDPYHICAFCGQVHDLREFVRPTEHPGLKPVA